MTDTTAEMVDTWQPGEIRRGQLLLALADGSSLQLPAKILILDVRPGPDISTIRVLWARDVQLTPTQRGPHIHEARWQLTDAGTGDPRDEGTTLVYLREPIGQYEPTDPDYNSLEILRDTAIATVANREQWAAQHRPAGVGEAAVAARQADAEADAARGHRDELIRAALAAGHSAHDLAAMTGLRLARIYQIRDGRR